MAENIRSIDDILREMFCGKDAALEKYAKVRKTQYEMNLWYKYGMPLSEIDGSSKVYFSKRFLNGERISSAKKDKLDDAFLRLNYAVTDGCHGRCSRLVEELNAALNRENLMVVSEPEKFLNWLTFDYSTVKDEYGGDVLEPGYSFPIQIFHDKENRKDFWKEIKLLLKDGKMLSMQDVCRVLLIKRRSISLKKSS